MRSVVIDTVKIDRFRQMVIGSEIGFLEHVFTSRERKYCAGTMNPTQTFAGHFAAKEALIKALPSIRKRGAGWQDIEISHGVAGAPQFVMNDNISQDLREASATGLLLTISHSADTAVAMVEVL